MLGFDPAHVIVLEGLKRWNCRISADDWYETLRMGDDVTLIHEPWIKPFYRCNMWHVRGRDRDLLFDSGLGHFCLRAHVPLVTERALTCVASHTHFDHIGSHHEFPRLLRASCRGGDPRRPAQ